MKKYIYIVIMICFTSSGYAQASMGSSAWKDVFYGGGFGFTGSRDYWSLNISPLLGYKFTPSFAGGVSMLYQHDKFHGYMPAYSINSFGAGAFLRYDLGPSLMKNLPFSFFTQTDYEGVRRTIKYESDRYTDNSDFVNRMYLGAGFAQKIGKRSRMYVMISFDMLNLNNRPLVRAGFEI